jgi:hypothetical protein
LGTEPRRRVTALAAGVLIAVTAGGCSSGGGTSQILGGPQAGGSASAAAGGAQSPSPPVSASAGTTAPATGPSPDSGAGGSGPAGIPTAAWMAPSAIPLYAAYHWPSPSSVAKSAKAPELSAVQDCRLALSSADRSELGAFPAAQADLSPTVGASGDQDDWTAQETILAANDTSSGDIQGIYNLYTDLVADLGKCASTASGAKVSVAVDHGPEYAATITIPTSTGSTLTWHEYLAAPYGYLVELSIYVAPYSGDKPSTSWDGSPAGTVLNALQSGPCGVTKLC